MKIKRINIENFRAIKSISLSGLDDTVVIAGPNGCGKSCIFDAIRLLKSVYGGYQPNEWHQWFGEFQIQIQSLDNLEIKRLFNDKTKPLKIEIGFEFSSEEKDFFRQNGAELIETQEWQRSTHARSSNISPTEVYQLRPTIDFKKSQALEDLLTDLNNDLFWGKLDISVDGKDNITPSPMLELCFTSYNPQHVGIIDYHGANRIYNREQVGGINLNTQSSEQNMKNHALYNSTNKYNNVKSEMAGAYIRGLVARDANISLNEKENLIETLKELFKEFFPGKRFLGPIPRPDGNLDFSVELDDGSTHDINELSSGEKEVLYGYLRLQNTTPKNSILLLDEPELHLNPRLIRGLPKFYQKHLGKENNNQIWLVTHSDALLRETVGEPGFSVFHMKSSLYSNSKNNQIVAINANDRLQGAFIDLVGDLAAYSPNSKVVIFEGDVDGGGDSDFDLTFVSTLFPEILEQANLISGENKTKVRQLHKLLEVAEKKGTLPYKFYSIVDLDNENRGDINSRYLTWDVYHIENYLLNSKYISKTINDIKGINSITEIEVEDMMKACAGKGIDSLLTHELRKHINNELISCIKLDIDPKSSSISDDLFSATNRSLTRINDVTNNQLTASAITDKEIEIKQSLQSAIYSEEWKNRFPGRVILKDLVKTVKLGINYEAFRNLLIAFLSLSDKIILLKYKKVLLWNY